MRVIHLACVAPPQIGGIGRVASQEVAALNERGVGAQLIAPMLGGVDYQGVINHALTSEDIIRMPAYWAIGNTAALRYDRLQECVRDADIVHLHYPFYGTAGMVAYLRRRGVIKRLVMTLHMDATARGMKGLYFDCHRKLAQPRILKMADALLVSSLDYACHSSYARFVNDRRMHELPFGVDEQRFTLVRRGGSFTVLFVGGMDKAHAFKGVDILLRAVAILPSDVTCSLVGDGDLRPGYEKLAKDIGITDRVTFRGRVSDEELPDAYRRAEIFTFPSTSGAEAFGLAALEAQACGVPVVASDLPGVRTVVANGETGFLVPPNDVNALAERLKYLLDHAEVRYAMGKRARERVIERFTWTKHLDGLMHVYRELMQ